MSTRSKVACEFSIRTLVADGSAYLWTLTTEDAIELKELSRRWRALISNGFAACVRVFEEHPGGHGYHVHFVCRERIDVNWLRPKAEAVGFGRIHVKVIPGAKAAYIAKYLTKQRREKAPGVRMWACVGFKGSRVADIEVSRTTLYGNWENGQWELKREAPTLDSSCWVRDSDGRLYLHRIWYWPKWTSELEREVREFPLGMWSDRHLRLRGFEKRGMWLTVLP